MKEIKILELTLRNFKGIKEFSLKLDGKNTSILGDNATGKTTIMDAFLWLLFGKDSQNSSNFNVKTLDKMGNVIHGLNHQVIAKLKVGGKQIELQKNYKEKWTKKRGEADRTLTGHATDYFINFVPKKKGEYESYLSNIIDEDTFKILTNPLYFNTSLKWQERREIALNICGELDDVDVFKKDNSLLQLREALEDKTIDDLKAEMAARRRKLNEELKSIPYRIDELTREDLDVDVEALAKEKKELEGQLAELKNADGVDYDFRLRVINGSIGSIENDIKILEQNLTKDLREQRNKELENTSRISEGYFAAKRYLENEKTARDYIKNNIKEMNDKIESLRENYKKVSDSHLDDSKTVCPTCDREFETDKIAEIKSSFEDRKKDTLLGINKDGKRLKGELEEKQKELDEIEKSISMREIELDMLMQDIEKSKMLTESLNNQIKEADVTTLPEYKELQERLIKVANEKVEISKLAVSQDNTADIKAVESEISNINKELAKVDLAKDNEERVQELKDRERELAQMVADTEKTVFLCEKYIVIKAGLLEENLNSMFKTVKFKLFDQQVNGGISETFVTTVEGVPFEDLNNAMKINAGLDIINTLSEHFKLIAPIFVDNAESITKLADVKAQVISLIVSESDKKLMVETI